MKGSLSQVSVASKSEADAKTAQRAERQRAEYDLWHSHRMAAECLVETRPHTKRSAEAQAAPHNTATGRSAQPHTTGLAGGRGTPHPRPVTRRRESRPDPPLLSRVRL